MSNVKIYTGKHPLLDPVILEAIADAPINITIPPAWRNEITPFPNDGLLHAIRSQLETTPIQIRATYERICLRINFEHLGAVFTGIAIIRSPLSKSNESIGIIAHCNDTVMTYNDWEDFSHGGRSIEAIHYTEPMEQGSYPLAAAMALPKENVSALLFKYQHLINLELLSHYDLLGPVFTRIGNYTHWLLPIPKDESMHPEYNRRICDLLYNNSDDQLGVNLLFVQWLSNRSYRDEKLMQLLRVRMGAELPDYIYGDTGTFRNYTSNLIHHIAARMYCVNNLHEHPEFSTELDEVHAFEY